jgi:hypothetical protein
MAYFLLCVSVVAAVALLLINLMATVSLYRTRQLSRGQKIAQGAFVWCLPFVGASLVMHLLADGDPDVVHQRLIPNDTVNAYVLQLLGVEARASLDATQSAIEHTIVDALSSHHGSDGGTHSAGGGDGH